MRKNIAKTEVIWKKNFRTISCILSLQKIAQTLTTFLFESILDDRLLHFSNISLYKIQLKINEKSPQKHKYYLYTNKEVISKVILTWISKMCCSIQSRLDKSTTSGITAASCSSPDIAVGTWIRVDLFASIGRRLQVSPRYISVWSMRGSYCSVNYFLVHLCKMNLRNTLTANI